MEINRERQAPAAAGPLLPPPGAVPPPATDAGHLELLGVLRLRARGVPVWMFPRYILLDVDIYSYNPRQLLESHAPATASDGTSALYFVNVVRAKTAGDYRERRSVPGGFWRSDRAPVPLISEAIQGTRRTFFYTETGSQGEKIGTGFMMQQFTLAGEEEALQGGDELALFKIYVSPHGGRDAADVANSINKRKIGEQGVANSSSKRRKMVAGAASFSPAPVRAASAPAKAPSSAPPLRRAPALPVRSSNLPQQDPSPAPPLRSAPALPVRSSSLPQQDPSPAPPLRSAPALPVRSSNLPQQDPSPAPPVGQGASISSAPTPRQGASSSSAPAASTSPNETKRFLVLEIGKSPLMERENILKHVIFSAAEIVGGTKRALDCNNLVIFEKKMLGTESLQDISSPGLDTHHLSFTFQELHAATLGFRRDHFLGEGRSAKVYKGVLLDGNNVAIKVLNPNGLHGKKDFCIEAMALSRIYHPNVVNLVGFCADNAQRVLIYEYMCLGSLEKHIFDLSPHKKPLDWNTRIKVLAGAAQGLKHLHVNCNPPEIHRDVKSGNILLCEGYHPKLSDFGLAKLGPPRDNTHVSTRVMGTPGYCAPEYLEGGELTIKSDVYSFGVVIVEVITGRKALGRSLTRAEPTLAEWATPLTRRNDVAKYADPALGNQYNKTSLKQVLSVARMCLNPSASLRPDMADVAAALTNISMSAATNI